MHYEDETHVETNPYLSRVRHRKGEQVLVPAAGTNRRLTVFGSVIAGEQGRVEVLTADPCSTGFVSYLQALDQRHTESGRKIFLVLDNGSAHTSQTSRTALDERAAWLHVVWLARLGNRLRAVDQIVLTEEFVADWAAATREGLRGGADGWIDDDLAFVQPWGFALTEITVPTVLRHGAEDLIAPIGHGRWPAERIPGVTAHLEEGQGHLSLWIGAIDRMLQELPAASRSHSGSKSASLP